MERTTVISRLKAAEHQIRAFGASSIYLFGSTARNEATQDSDVDIFFDRDPNKSFGMMELTGLQFMVEDLLGTPVDIGTRDSLHPFIRAMVEHEAIQVF